MVNRLLIVGALAAVILVPAGHAAEPTPSPVTVVSPDAVQTTPGAEATLILRNETGSRVKAELSVVGSGDTVTVRTADGTAEVTLEAFAVSRVDLTFATDQAEADTTGVLVVRADGGAPSAVPFALAAHKTFRDETLWLLLVPLILAIFLVGFTVLVIGLSPRRLDDQMGSVEWSFSDSWASNLTLAGALLGTVLAAGVLPEETSLLPQPGYAALNLFFGLLVLVAPIVYSACSASVAGGEDPKYRGYVWSFLLAATLTAWGVAGELITVAWLFRELRANDALADETVNFLIGALLVLGLALAVYVGRTVADRVEKQPAVETKKKRKARKGARAPAAPADLPTWSAL